ncbi:phosphate ABC transporter permease PstA [Parazoarcus communis]|uniref:Phosphate transport system permease protein PstA n=1 Tax=Parazoarcus communis SWub3 = DSM 12120 TaxID=1121029 RepID=A0A323V0D2_9RHOO|nr:phosphate ABC transporter permease PstA [Parazoarcus communis]NMG69025.1 phosphate ABC transporter permease PstA [Parazoarcus communis SWub3 = DSM 12120]PZA16886.1 phosphate ABC transporter permease PtsA [Azoarcus communis] [Parazoarcus communis SWub3 = DSM 12120]
MNTTNQTNLQDREAAWAKQRRVVEQSLARRHAAERRFRGLGLSGVIFGLAMVALLFVTILAKGLPAFWQATIPVEIYFDPQIIEVEQRPGLLPGESAAQLREREMAWQTQLTMSNWNRLIENALLEFVPEAADSRAELRRLVTSGERFRLRDMVVADPSLIGKRVRLDLLADANIDVWLKGNIDRDLPDNQQQLSAKLRQWADDLYARDVIRMSFSTALFANTDSRSSLASAGLAGALAGSLYMMLIVILLAVPVGVASAIYLQEFAPRNKFTDLIEVNINNLAAVPSIIFGLLGAAVFINWFKMPLSAPIVGGLVLSLMTLPTVIIATRSALQAIPPSIRQAALGIGASKMQTIFHHVLPLALPGILTGAIIGVAQAIGETAPLLLIGMSAFVAAVPATPFDQSTALPVQIYLWQGNELRNFFEARTSAAIIVLLSVMITLNAFAIWLRKRFEKRW